MGTLLVKLPAQTGRTVVGKTGGIPPKSYAIDSSSDRLLTVDQVAHWLQVKPRTIYQWVHEEYIPAIKLGALLRFNRSSVTAWVKKREAAGRTPRRPAVEIN